MNDLDIEIVNDSNNSTNTADNNTSTDFSNVPNSDMFQMAGEENQPQQTESTPVQNNETNNNIEIKDNSNTNNNQNVDILSQTVTIDTIPQDKKAAQKLEKELAKKAKQEQKEKKKEETVSSSNNQEIKIIETAVTTGASGSQTIGSISGDQVVSTNNPMPAPIDVTVKQKTDTKDKTKKVKVVTKADKIIGIIAKVFVVIVIGVGIYAAYYFGYKTNPSLFSVKNMVFELGDDIPSSVSKYINKQNQADDMEYTLDLSNVSKDIAGTYTYSVTRKNVKKTGQITIKDTKPPTITFKDSKDLKFSKDSKITKDDVVESCTDISNCTFDLDYQIDTETAGDKEVKVHARDDAGNEAHESVSVSVIDIKTTLVCSSEKINSSDNTYYTELVETLNFDSNDNLVQSLSTRRYTYIDLFLFFSKLNEIEKDDKYIVDKEHFNYSEKLETKSINMSSLRDVRNYYVENGYTCK